MCDKCETLKTDLGTSLRETADTFTAEAGLPIGAVKIAVAAKSVDTLSAEELQLICTALASAAVRLTMAGYIGEAATVVELACKVAEMKKTGGLVCAVPF